MVVQVMVMVMVVVVAVVVVVVVVLLLLRDRHDPVLAVTLLLPIIADQTHNISHPVLPSRPRDLIVGL